MASSAALVVISPHLDDAVLSLGAHLAGRVRAGEQVEVWTAFTDGPSPDSAPRRLRRFGDYAARRAEDDRALAVLGAGNRRLGLPERVWRTPPAHGLAAAFRTPEVRSGFTELPALEAVAADLLIRRGTRLLAPLGVGHHVDHVEVAVAVLGTALRLDALDRVGFYEDFYALGDGARRRHPVTGGRAGVDPDRHWAPGWAAPWEGLVLAATGWIGRGPSLDSYVPGFAELVWQAVPHPVDPWCEQRKLAAVAEYRSQTPALGGMRRLGPILRRAHRVRGGEVIWSARRP